MTVNGKLLAEGTAQDSIIFTGNQWTGIFIDYQSNGGSKIKYSRIANASASGCPNGNCYGQIQLVNTELSNSNIYNIYSGINAYNQSVLKFNEIHDMNNNTGLSLGSGSEAYGNVFYRSGINYSSNPFIYISGSVILSITVIFISVPSSRTSLVLISILDFVVKIGESVEKEDWLRGIELG